MPEPSQPIDRILQAILPWATSQQDIRGLALVGSHARGAARQDSDIDLVLLVAAPETFRSDISWIEIIDWPAIGARVATWRDEDYGAVWSRRLWLDPALEVEMSFAPLTWANIAPLDPGTRRVISNGYVILYDPDEAFHRLCSAVKTAPDTTRPAP
jgi:hypothetical protein